MPPEAPVTIATLPDEPLIASPPPAARRAPAAGPPRDGRRPRLRSPSPPCLASRSSRPLSASLFRGRRARGGGPPRSFRQERDTSPAPPRWPCVVSSTCHERGGGSGPLSG